MRPRLPDPSPATLQFEPTPAAVPLARRRAARRYWFAGAAAAAVVLLAAGALWHGYHDGHAARETVIIKQKEIVSEIDAQLVKLEPRFNSETKEIEARLRAEAPLNLNVLGPTRIQRDGGETVQVTLNDLDGNPVTGKVALSLVDVATKKVLARNEAVAANGSATVPMGEGFANALAGHSTVQLIAEAEAGLARATLRETLQVAAPAYVAHLMTNKTAYRPGDLLFFRALVLDRAGLTPPANTIALQFTLVDAKGNVVAATQGTTAPNGIAAGELAVTPKWADGDYELRVAAVQAGAPEVRPHARKLQIARDVYYDVQLDRERYRAGDIVKFGVPRTLTQTAQAKLPESAALAPKYELFLNNQQVPLLRAAPGGQASNSTGVTPSSVPPATTALPQQPQPVAPQGPPGQGIGGGFGGYNAAMDRLSQNQMNFEFALPKDLDTSRVHLRVVLTEGKVQETFEQELAVMPSRLVVDLFPEGGDLIAGVPNRVYYRLRSPRGEPVNPEGRVIVLSRSQVLLDSAPGQGAGSFTFTPEAGDTYSVRITNSGGEPTELPDPFAHMGGVHDTGVVLHTPRPVAAEGEPLDVVLRNPGAPRRILLVAQCRGRSVGQQWVDAKGPNTSVALGTLPSVHGLVRLTAYDVGDGALKPLAERLVYRTPARRLDLTALHLGGVVSQKIGQRSVQLEFRCSDEAGERVDGWLGCCVVDERCHTPEPNPIAHFFIAGDVRNGEDLDNAVLLAADTAPTRQALDLFLGTVGWRHFTPAAAKVVAAAAPAIDAAFFGRANASPRTLQADHEKRVAETLNPVRAEMLQQHMTLTLARQVAEGALDQARTDLREYEARPAEYFRLGLGATTLILFALSCLTLAVGAWRLVRRHQATLLFAGSFACMGVCLVATLLVAWLGAPVDSLSPRLAQRSQDIWQLPKGVNERPRIDVPSGPPTGQFALARQAVADDKADKDGSKAKDQHANPLADMADAKKYPTASYQRGAALTNSAVANDNAGKKSDLHRRFDEALAKQEKETAMKPIGVAPGSPPAPLGSGADTKAPKAKDAVEQQAERAYHYVAGVEFDTLLWHPALFLPGGSAQVAFDVPAVPGTFRVLLIGNTADGRLGFYEGRLEVQPDLSL